MIITQTILNNLRVGFSKRFKDGLANGESCWQKVATLVTSTGKSTTYGWLGKFPKMREWIGDRVINNISEHAYSVVNKKYELSVGVARDDIEDDETGTYGPMFEELGQSAKEHPDEMVFGLLKAGFTETCYDGQNFFDTDHPVYPNADGTGAATTVSNMQDGTEAAWFLLDTTRPLKPLIYQQRRAMEFESLTKATESEAAWMRDEYQYGVAGRNNAGFGFWQQAFGSKAVLNADNLQLADESMIAVKGDGEKVLNIKPSVLVVGPSNKWKAKELLGNEKLANGKDNKFYKAYDLLVVGWLD